MQAYTEAIKEKGITLEDAKAEADALASKLFVRAEKSWIEQHADLYEEGFEKAKAAMMEYAQGKTSMVKAFTDQGLFAPPQELFPALAYAGRQMASAVTRAASVKNSERAQGRGSKEDYSYEALTEKLYNERISNGLLYSFRATSAKDAAYMQALDSGDEEKAQRMVDEAAKEAGYTEKAYHGSPSFGFTQFDMEKRPK